MPRATDIDRRERILSEARALLDRSKGKTWEQLAAEKETDTIFAEPLTDEELFKSPMSYPFRLPRSRSADFSCTSRRSSISSVSSRHDDGKSGERTESYLSRWSRENTPTENCARYARQVRRSYTPVRDVADARVVEESRRPYSSYRDRTPVSLITLPYRTNINYSQEEQPIRKYDVFQVRTWSYPIYKYLNHRDHDYERPYSYTRSYGTTPLYTPPTMTLDSKSRVDGRRGYSGYAYVGSASTFDLTSRPRSLQNYNQWRSNYASTPWYSSYYGNSALRHFNSYRPRIYNPAVNTLWRPYY